VEAAVELLIGHGSWLGREDFRGVAVEVDRDVVGGAVLAVVDWEAAVAALDAGRLPCSSSQAQVLRLAVSLAEGLAVDLRAALSGLDERNAALVAAAVLHAAGHRELGGQLCGWGERW
jgi:hypothetical protein